MLGVRRNVKLSFFKSASVGFKIAIVLLLGEKYKNFNGQADVCRSCERACVPE